jgi:hypothetical protein
MSPIAALTLALAALTSAPAVAQTRAQTPAETNDFAQYDATRAQSVAERLVLCDIADQLSNGAPNRDAHRAYVREDGGGRLELALPPDFTRPSGWYDYNIERAYDRYRRAGQVRSTEVLDARERFRTPLRSRFHQISIGERRFFQSQSRFCADFVRASRGA